MSAIGNLRHKITDAKRHAWTTRRRNADDDMNQQQKRSCTPFVQAVQVASIGGNATSVDISGQSADSTAYFYVTAYNLTSNASSGWVSVVTPTAATIAPRSNLVSSASSDCHAAKSCAQNSMESRRCAATLLKSSGAHVSANGHERLAEVYVAKHSAHRSAV